MRGAFGHNPFEDAIRAVRAIATNRLARAMPRVYVRATGETGRGREAPPSAETVRHFLQCVHDYLEVLGKAASEAARFWNAKRVLEYGPGDIPGVALLLVGHGARSVLCVDRFPLVRFDDYQRRVIEEIAAPLPDDAARDRLWACFKDRHDLCAGLRQGPVSYLITESGIVVQKGVADVVISRAVLEHVNDLTAMFDDMAAVLTDDGIAIHKVDLKSHGLHRDNCLDFLTWPEGLWRLMYSHKGAPNRIRVDRYLRETERVGFRLDVLSPCEAASIEDVEAIRPHLADPFRCLTDQHLCWLSFWMVARHSKLADRRRLDQQ